MRARRPSLIAVASVSLAAAVGGCSDSGGSEAGSCLSELVVPGEGPVDFVDYDLARETGALGADDELAAPSIENGRDYVVLAETGLYYPGVINVPLNRAGFEGAPVGIRDVRCSMDWWPGSTSVSLLVDGASFDVEADSLLGRVEVDGDRVAVSNDDDVDLEALLEEPADAQGGVEREVIDELVARSVHQGSVFPTAESGEVRAVGESMVDGDRRVVVLWRMPGSDADELVATFDEAMDESGVADDLVVAEADVNVEDGQLVATIPIVGDAAVMRRMLQTVDALLAPAFLD